jgi:hypothetical protein
MSKLNSRLSALLVLSVALSWTCRAQDSVALSGIRGDAFSVQGFGTLGAARSTHGSTSPILRSIRHPKGIGTNWTAKQDSVLGLQTQYRFNERAIATIQATSYYREDGSFDPDITAAFLKFDIDPRFFVRLGRVPLELLMLADMRMVGYSYIPIRSASEWYSVPLNYVDGASARWIFPLGDGLVNINGIAGIAREDSPMLDFGGAKALKGSIGYEIGDWQFQYFYAQARLSHNMTALTPLRGELTNFGLGHVAHKLATRGTTTVFQSLGIGYDDGVWQMQVVADTMRSGSYALMDGKGLHAMLGRRMGNITPYVGYSRAQTDPKKLSTGLPNLCPQGPIDPCQQLNLGLAMAMREPSSHTRTETFMLGARWDFQRNMALKAQADFMRGLRGGKSSMTPYTGRPDLSKRTTLISISLDFVF